ncbi:AraC family transcriptional regulator [Neobacillus ginsengisoli]|uniref:Two-component system response regulator YesN n=1 Tax=Neobacillus ginsengisoli TaxID=904295 RepID=A0ABT9XUA4_9BACI|nr:AraC family transcriptional regulator [Neobacillus ginsengisoli]MDQ0199127.1 two-component system response regulator YesN [Neobacillus ginsengisoli]
MIQELTQIAFSQLLLSGTLVHVAPFEELQEKYGVNIQPEVVMLVSVDRYPDLAAGKQMDWKIDIGKKLVDELRGVLSVPFLWTWTEEGVLALLLEYKEVNYADRKRDILLLAEEIQRESDHIGICVSIGIGGFYDDPNLLFRSFEEAKKSMSGRFFQGNKLIFHTDMKRDIDDTLKNPLTREKAELLSLVRIGHKEGVVTKIISFMEIVAKSYQFNEDLFKSEVMDLLMMMSRMVLDMGVKPVTIMTSNGSFIQELYHTIRYDKFVKKVSDYAEWLTEQVEKSTTSNLSPIIKRAIRYIKENHQKSILLEEIAHHCHLSRFHFSHLFKKEAGISVMDYLNKVKIDQAVFYLETTDLSIQEIANQVGFKDANYFSRLFKKYMQFTPTEYRGDRHPSWTNVLICLYGEDSGGKEK